jgi:protein-S-isoprenylcysteine O-methyltransferase Ste14
MSHWSFLIVAAALLSLERICYVWVWHYPDKFRKFCDRPAVAVFGEPVVVLEKLFYFFKGIQIAVFLGWCAFYGFGSLSLFSDRVLPLAVGLGLIIIGQTLNLSVFYRLGRIGVFYGNRFGYETQWCNELPFSLFKHPQYVGALVSVWGFFVATRFPHSDWYLLPALETVYYVMGAHFEQERSSSESGPLEEDAALERESSQGVEKQLCESR